MTDTQTEDNQSTDSTAGPVPKNFDINYFEATRSIISKQANHLQELNKELKLINEQLKSLLENDGQLSESQAEAKELNQKVKTRKTELLETNEAKTLKLKIADLKEERTDLEDSLTNHLLDLYQATGVMEFEDAQGNLWEFNLKARIKAKKNI